MNFANVNCKEIPTDLWAKGNLFSPYPNNDMNGYWYMERINICMFAMCILDKQDWIFKLTYL